MRSKKNGKKQEDKNIKKEKQLSFLIQINNKALPQEKTPAKLKKACYLSRPVSGLFFDNLIKRNLIDVKTAGEICGVTPKTIHNWVSLRSIPYIKIGRKVMFSS